MANKFIDLEHLAENSFVGKRTGNNTKIEVLVSRGAGNGLQLRNDGLFVAGASGTTDFVLNPTRFVTVSALGGEEAQNSRKMLSVFGVLGCITLVFKTTNTGRHTIFNLPADAPMPKSMIAAQTYTGGLIWIEPNSRAIIGNNLRANTDYSLTMVGFFNV